MTPRLRGASFVLSEHEATLLYDHGLLVGLHMSDVQRQQEMGTDVLAEAVEAADQVYACA